MLFNNSFPYLIRFVISYTVMGYIWKGVVISATVHGFMILCSALVSGEHRYHLRVKCKFFYQVNSYIINFYESSTDKQ